MSDIVQKLWGFCHTLRHDGVDYGDYIEQLRSETRGAALPDVSVAEFERFNLVVLPSDDDWENMVTVGAIAEFHPKK